MRLGLVARADKTGLGVQTWTFWRNMKPDATLVVDLSHCSGQKPDLSLYAGDPNVSVWSNTHYPSIKPTPDRVVDEFLQKVDVVFSAETFYNYWFLERARQLGVRTILQPNFEFLDYILYRGLPEPDVFAFPSTWNIDEARRLLPGRDIRYLPVPVDTELLPYRHRPSFDTILHTAGTPAMEDRNGTELLIDAMRIVESPVRAVIRTQKNLTWRVPPNVEIDGRHIPNYWDLYGEGDLYVMPRKFGGLCLPLNEALAVGMPVLMTAVPPQSEFLPPDLLVRAPKVKEVMCRSMIGIHELDPRDLAQRIDMLYAHQDVFADLSRWAGEWARDHSWSALRPLYNETLLGEEKAAA